jgi:DNA-binding NarL/FixJ family response regulator
MISVQGYTDFTSQFTPREREILTLLSTGLDTLQISNRLKCPAGRIKEEMRVIFQKLSAENRTHAVAEALRTGVIK